MSTHASHSHAAKAAIPVVLPVAPVVSPAHPVVPHKAPPASAALDEKTPHSAKALAERSLAKHRIATEQVPAGTVPSPTVDEGDEGKK